MTTQVLKGRNTIRRGGSVSGATGQTSRFIQRWRFDPMPDTTLARLESAYMASLDAVDRIEERTRSNAANGKLTPEGVRDDALKFALAEIIPSLHRARMTIKRAKAEIAERRAKLKVEGPDKSDVAAAFRRMEVRTHLRDMDAATQSEYFARYGDSLPTEILQAVTELPAEYSGVPKSRHDLLTKRALTALHGSELADIAELEEAIDAAETVVETGRDEVRLEVGGIDKQRWDELAAPVEARHAAPWLRRRGNEVRVVDLERRIERPLNPDELAIGIFANSYDEYLREQKTLTPAA
jgi:hypothetical protein